MLIKSKSMAIDNKKSNVEPPQLKAKVTNKIYAKNKKIDSTESMSDKIEPGWRVVSGIGFSGVTVSL